MEFMLAWFIFTKRIVSFRKHWFFFSGGTYFGRLSQPLVGWLVIINNLSNQLILSFTPKKHRWWPLLIVLFKIGGTSTTVTGVEIEFWNKNNNRIHLMFERIEKHVHWDSISMTCEMWKCGVPSWSSVVEQQRRLKTAPQGNATPEACKPTTIVRKTRRRRGHGRTIFSSWLCWFYICVRATPFFVQIIWCNEKVNTLQAFSNMKR